MNEPTAAELLWKAAHVLTRIPDADAAIMTSEMTSRYAGMVVDLAEDLEALADRMVFAAIPLEEAGQHASGA
jgi:hypothetical protein